MTEMSKKKNRYEVHYHADV